MDDDAASKAGQMHRLHGEMLKARMAVLPYLLGWFLFVLVNRTGFAGGSNF
jgi:hypothetical protein